MPHYKRAMTDEELKSCKSYALLLPVMKERTLDWFRLYNPVFGDFPARLIQDGKGEKVYNHLLQILNGT